jgi:DNA-binding GntR family transcriptional regulator
MDGVTPRKNGAGHVYAKLKHLLVNYRFKPNTQLPPNELANRLNVSSTPVREALHHLAGEHLLTSIQNKGFYSKGRSLEEMKELSVLSNVLLQYAIANSAAPLNGEHLLKYPTSENAIALAQIDQIISDACFIEAALERVAALSCNCCLLMMIRNLNDRTHYVRLLDLEAEERRFQLLQQTKCLIEQVRHRKIPDAIDNLQEQLRLSMSTLPQLVREGIVRSYSVSAFDLALSDRMARGAWVQDREPH